jgi:hypothetical protein
MSGFNTSIRSVNVTLTHADRVILTVLNQKTSPNPSYTLKNGMTGHLAGGESSKAARDSGTSRI